MSQKIAVALVHGIGDQTEDSTLEMKTHLLAACQAINPQAEIVIEVVYWAHVMRDTAEKLWERLSNDTEKPLSFAWLRRLMIEYMGDALAYQISENDRYSYDLVHQIFADTLRKLAESAGNNAPLTVIAHSLGTVIANNYLYDLQTEEQRHFIARIVRQRMQDTPLERGETLTNLYTLGSPLPVWTMRFDDFGTPVKVPSAQLHRYYPTLSGEWVNFYDPDDLLAYPLKTLNDAYNQIITEDRPVDVGRFYERWSPLSHIAYLRDSEVIDPIAQTLCDNWARVNPPSQK